MIAALTGTLVGKSPQSLVLDVHGVGYEIFTSLQTYYRLPEPKETVHLHIHTHVREDALNLYGFLGSEEKAAFLLVTSVSGIGPRLALALLSGLTVRELASAIRASDAKRLCAVPGVGQKTAARLILELQDKMATLAATETPASAAREPAATAADDALSALVNLGYQPAAAREAIRQIEQSAPPGGMLPVEALLREALRRLSR
jgi:Holliday junction DNA helicase RuvA